MSNICNVCQIQKHILNYGSTVIQFKIFKINDVSRHKS